MIVFNFNLKNKVNIHESILIGKNDEYKQVELKEQILHTEFQIIIVNSTLSKG